MKDLSKKLYEKLQKIDEGNLGIEELEEVVNDAQELYERLVILRFKAYEKYGNPEELIDEVVEDELEASSEEVVSEVVQEEVEEVIKETPEETVKEVEEPAIDFSGITEETDQPSFDFSASDEVGTSSEDEETETEETFVEPVKEEEPFPEDADIKNEAPKETEASETFPEDAEIKTHKSDIFKDSHVEKHEPEDENSLNQKLQDDEDELSLRKKLQSTPVTDLKSEISIAKKFEYITFMFDGKNELYEEAITALNSCNDGEEAKDKLNEYSTKYNWDLENKSIIKFVELVERRYI